MKRTFFAALLLTLSCHAMAQNHFNLKFATKSEAEKYIVEPDHYTEGWSQFDIDSRLGKTGGTRSELQALQKQECREFTQAEQDTIIKTFHMLEDKINAAGFHLPLPKEIVLVKTTMHEEGDAGAYTRDNRIYVGERDMESNATRLMSLMGHELFHVLTRNSLPFKRAMYTTIGFTVMPHEVDFPQDILEHRISNPDVSLYDSFAYLTTIYGKVYPCTMINYCMDEYKGGSFFNYLHIGFIPLDEQHKPIQENGKTRIFDPAEVTDFELQIGKNTGYTINPEECLADNFSATVTGNVTMHKRNPYGGDPLVELLPNMDLINRIKAVLSQEW